MARCVKHLLPRCDVSEVGLAHADGFLSFHEWKKCFNKNTTRTDYADATQRIFEQLLTTEETSSTNTPVPIEQSKQNGPKNPGNKYSQPRKRTNNCKIERQWVVQCHNYHKTRWEIVQEKAWLVWLLDADGSDQPDYQSVQVGKMKMTMMRHVPNRPFQHVQGKSIIMESKNAPTTLLVQTVKSGTSSNVIRPRNCVGVLNQKRAFMITIFALLRRMGSCAVVRDLASNDLLF